MTTVLASAYHQPRTYPSARFPSLPATAAALPVVVIGAGPVGMAVALGLARRGTPVTVLEAADQVSFGSRAICISRHSLEVLERLGLGEQLDATVLPWEGGRSFYREQEVLRFRMPNEPHSVRGPMVNVSQSELEQVMADALEAHPLVTLHWNAALTGLAEHGDEVSVDVDTIDGPRTLRARWVVAADGGRSRTREQLGLSLRGTSYEGRYVIADIHWPSDLPAERMVWFDPPSNPGSTVIMHQQPNDIWRVDYQLDPTEDAEVEVREDRIRRRIGLHLDWLQSDVPWTLEWHGFYRAHSLALDDFVHGRVLFTGDAAHLVPIFGVRGLNSGLEDAETLTWMLSAVLAAKAEPQLLQAYSRERHHAWEQNVANAGKSTLIMAPGSHGHRTTRDAVLALSTTHPEFSHLINPRQSSATHSRTSPLSTPLAGAPADPAGPVGGEAAGPHSGDPVEDRRVNLVDGTATSLGRLRGPGFGVFAFADEGEGQASVLRQAQALAGELASAFAPERVTFTAVVGPAGAGTARGGHSACPSAVDDRAGVLARDWGARSGDVYVVRPDGLLLARGPVGQLGDLAGRVRAGGRAGTGGIGGTGGAQEVSIPIGAREARHEAAWAALSKGIDDAPADDREAFLARLALLLADRVPSEEFAEALAAAAAVR